MEQKAELRIEGIPENIKEVFEFLNVDKTQRSDNKNDLFVVFEKPSHENSLCTGYTDSELDPELDIFYSEPKNENCIAFKSYRKNLFKFAQFLSEKFLACRFKLSWLEKYQGDECLFVLVIEKSCVIYFQRGVSYTIAPNLETFLSENNLTKYVENHSRKESETIE